MKTFNQFLSEMENHLGETQYRSKAAWIKAIKTAWPVAEIQTHEDTAIAILGEKTLGEWDGETGVIYNNAHKTTAIVPSQPIKQTSFV